MIPLFGFVSTKMEDLKDAALFAEASSYLIVVVIAYSK